MTETWNPVEKAAEVVGEEMIRKHLSMHLHAIAAEIAAIEAVMGKLEDLRAQLDRAGRALAAFNETHPAAPVESFGCSACERTFTTKGGRSRHENTHVNVDDEARREFERTLDL